MKTSTTGYISLFVGILFIIIWHFDLFKKVPLFYCEGIGCLGVGLELAVIGLVFIPVIFGLLGYFLSDDRKLAHVCKSSGISFLVMVASLAVVWGWNEYDIKKAVELNDRYVEEVNLRGSN